MTRIKQLQEEWQETWHKALYIWTRYPRLSEPIWCVTEKEEKKEQLTGSFAMIRLNDHAVVISLRQTIEYGLEEYALEILAHEIGHHILCPANLQDYSRAIASTRYCLPGLEEHAPMVLNLFEDLLINVSST